MVSEVLTWGIFLMVGFALGLATSEWIMGIKDDIHSIDEDVQRLADERKGA